MEKEDFRKLRTIIGCSAKNFAKLIGSNECSIYNYEAGRAKPRYDAIEKRMKALLRVFDFLRNDPDYFVKLFDKIDNNNI